MTIERSQAPQNAEQAKEPERSDRRTEPRNEPPPKEQVDRFRQVLQSKQEGRDEFLAARARGAGELSGQQRAETAAAAHQGVTQDAVEALRYSAQDSGSGSQQAQQGALEPAEVLAMLQAQTALRDGAQAPAAPPANTAAFADLIERHVRQLAVGGGNAAADDGQVLLRMADATLPGTDLLLTKTADGWLLRADVRSRGSFDAIREAAPELARRFAERNLGTLEIDPHLHV